MGNTSCKQMGNTSCKQMGNTGGDGVRLGGRRGGGGMADLWLLLSRLAMAHLDGLGELGRRLAWLARVAPERVEERGPVVVVDEEGDVLELLPHGGGDVESQIGLQLRPASAHEEEDVRRRQRLRLGHWELAAVRQQRARPVVARQFVEVLATFRVDLEPAQPPLHRRIGAPDLADELAQHGRRDRRPDAPHECTRDRLEHGGPEVQPHHTSLEPRVIGGARILHILFGERHPPPALGRPCAVVAQEPRDRLDHLHPPPRIDGRRNEDRRQPLNVVQRQALLARAAAVLLAQAAAKKLPRARSIRDVEALACKDIEDATHLRQLLDRHAQLPRQRAASGRPDLRRVGPCIGDDVLESDARDEQVDGKVGAPVVEHAAAAQPGAADRVHGAAGVVEVDALQARAVAAQLPVAIRDVARVVRVGGGVQVHARVRVVQWSISIHGLAPRHVLWRHSFPRRVRHGHAWLIRTGVLIWRRHVHLSRAFLHRGKTPQRRRRHRAHRANRRRECMLHALAFALSGFSAALPLVKLGSQCGKLALEARRPPLF